LGHDTLTEHAEALGWAVVPNQLETEYRLEVPRGSGVYLVGKPVPGREDWILRGRITIDEDHLATFDRTDEASKTNTMDDLAAYLCLFDIEYEFDMRDLRPHSIELAVRWSSGGDAAGLRDRVRLLLRARQGTIHTLRAAFRRLSDGTDRR